MNKNAKTRRVGDVVATVPWLGPGGEPLRWMANLLRTEGTDLMSADDPELKRGTPVFVEADADVVEVQRVMARLHIRRYPF